MITNDSIDEMIRANRRAWTRDIIEDLNVSKGTIRIIIHQNLQYIKVCAEWIPKTLTLDHEKQRICLILQHLIHYEEDPAFLERIVAGDESWYHHTPESKKTNMQWKHT